MASINHQCAWLLHGILIPENVLCVVLVFYNNSCITQFKKDLDPQLLKYDDNQTRIEQNCILGKTKCTRNIGRQLSVNSSPPLDKMAAILADDIFKCIFLNEDDKIPIQISLKLAPRNPIDKNQHWFR